MLKTRVITALILVACFIPCLYFAPEFLWQAVISLICLLAAWEWGQFYQLNARQRQYYALLVLLINCAVIWLSQTAEQPSILAKYIYALSLLFWCLWVPYALYKQPKLPTIAGLLSGIVVIIPVALALIQLRQASANSLLLSMAGVWLADSAAYFSGRRFGKHLLAKSISPGKTWEGVAGAVLAVTLYFYCAAAYLPFLNIFKQNSLFSSELARIIVIMGIAVLFTALSIIGDLFESLLKRQAKLKDSSQLLPGHGGILDRIDSQTSVMPFLALLYLWYH